MLSLGEKKKRAKNGKRWTNRDKTLWEERKITILSIDHNRTQKAMTKL